MTNYVSENSIICQARSVKWVGQKCLYWRNVTKMCFQTVNSNNFYSSLKNMEVELCRCHKSNTRHREPHKPLERGGNLGQPRLCSRHYGTQEALTGTIFPFLWISIQLAELRYLNFIQHFSRRLLNNWEAIDCSKIKF